MKHDAKTVLICTEGGPGIGLGHVTRCASMASAFLANGFETWVLFSGNIDVGMHFPGCHYRQNDWVKEPMNVCLQIGMPRVLVLDSYRVTNDLIDRMVDRTVVKILYFDDLMVRELQGCILVNGSPGAPFLYGNARYNGATLFLGVQWQALRSAFWNIDHRKVNETINHLLLSLGADDIHYLLPSLYRQIKKSFPWKVTILCADFSRSIEELKSLAVSGDVVASGFDVNAMKRLLLDVDLAITAGGQTTFELARTGVPAIFIEIAENQRHNLDAWKNLGFASTILPWNSKDLGGQVCDQIRNLSSLEARKELSLRGQSIVDGQGALRIVAALEI